MAQEKTSKKKTNKVSDAKRHGIQAVWAFLTNSHVSGFVTGKIYTGKLKNVCVPGLNCYSCPGAVGACPIGSLQAVVGSWNFKMAYYVVGFLIFIGAIFGRLICGFLCPFGLIQDLLNKIPFPKKIRTFKGDKLLLQAEICNICCVCYFASYVFSGHYGTGLTIFLQAYMSSWNA